MTKKGCFTWTYVGERAFEELKKTMTTTPILAMLDFNSTFEVNTDASGIGLGAVLIQHCRPLAYLSKALGIKKIQ